MFTYQKPDNLVIHPRYSNSEDGDGVYKSRPSILHGLTVDYKKLLNKRFSLELFLGAGYAISHYKGYIGLDRVELINEENYRPFNGSGEVLIY
jgi:hypothetical protein